MDNEKIMIPIKYPTRGCECEKCGTLIKDMSIKEYVPLDECRTGNIYICTDCGTKHEHYYDLKRG